MTLSYNSIKPLGQRILVEPIQEDMKTKSGIVLAETAEKPLPIKGKVLAAGPLVDESISEGIVIIFDRYAPNEFEFDGKKLMILHEEDVKAVYTS